MTIPERGRLQYRSYGGRADWREGLAKAWGTSQGYEGGQGGWIYNARGVNVIQGWRAFYGLNKRHILDWATRKMTGFATFRELLTAHEPYRPTFLVRKGSLDGWMVEALAEAYDEAQRERGDGRRAHRGRGYLKLADVTGGMSRGTHLVQGEHEADGRAICGDRFERAWSDLRPTNVNRVTCDRCKHMSGIA